MKVAFIGLGRMGSAMARNLLRAGHALTVYNRTRAKADELAAEGARVADSPADAARDCEAAVSMLADDHAVEEAVFGERGLARGLQSGAIHVSSSTISTALARRLTAEHNSRRQRYLSATVLGRPEAAEAKHLLIVAAGEADIVDRCKPLFDAIGRQAFVAGREPWQSNATKLCCNFMIASMLESFGEAYATLNKASVDAHLFLDIMNAAFGSPLYANYGRIIADQAYQPAAFALKLGFKDIRLMLETAEECQSPMPVASLIRDHFLSAMALGQGDWEWASVARIVARNSGQ